MSTEKQSTAGKLIKDWCPGVPMSVRGYYNIPAELRPRHTNIGGKTLIIETQREWLERVAAAGGIPAKGAKVVEAEAA